MTNANCQTMTRPIRRPFCRVTSRPDGPLAVFDLDGGWMRMALAVADAVVSRYLFVALGKLGVLEPMPKCTY